MPEKNNELKDPREWVKDLDIESTEDIAVPKSPPCRQEFKNLGHLHVEAGEPDHNRRADSIASSLRYW